MSEGKGSNWLDFAVCVMGVVTGLALGRLVMWVLG